MKHIDANEAAQIIGRHMMVKDHFSMVMDLEKSHGPYIYEARDHIGEGDALHSLGEDERQYLDFYTQFASWPISYNHPGLKDPEYQEKLIRAAQIRIACSDIVTREMAEFVSVMSEVAIPPDLQSLFLIDGGALAVENALKTAFDWKIRMNFKRGILHDEDDYQIAHFRQAFHGRTGYTMSLTNTDPTKVKFFPKFRWPRIENPRIIFPLEEHLHEVEAAENRAISQLEDAIHRTPHTIAAVILETIQGEGGDNHFRPEFFRRLRGLTEAHDILLILDEVQAGVGLTGKFWAFQHMGITPDIIAFGKKMQVCGILANKRKLAMVDNHVFQEPSRINSTWGGSLVDMIRSARMLEIIRDERLVENAAEQGHYLLSQLQELQAEFPRLIYHARGRGLMCAFDFRDPNNRGTFIKEMLRRRVLVLACGNHGVRFRPMLDIRREHLDAFSRAAREVLHTLG